jgi:hypothetical protein
VTFDTAQTGKRYCAEAWVIRDGLAPTAQLAFNMRSFNASGGSHRDLGGVDVASPDGGWTRATIGFPLPLTYDRGVLVRFSADPSPDASYYVDDVALWEETEPLGICIPQ